jgi:hypothetical protein
VGLDRSPADAARAAEYDAGPYAGFADQVRTAFAAIVPKDADVSPVADPIVKWSIRHLAGGRCVCTSIRPRMVRRSSTLYPTVSVPSCFAGSGSAIC